MQKPILDQISFDFGDIDAPIQTKRNIPLYVAIAVLACGLLIVLGLYASKLIIGSPDVEKIMSTRLVPTGYLQANKSHYVNVGDRLFADHPTNFSVSMSLDKEPRTVWIQEFLNEARDSFVLKTEIQGLVFSLQSGPPGAGAPWGVAFLAPVVRALNNNVVLMPNKSSFKAISPAWPDDLIYLTVYQETGQIYWTSSPGNQLAQITLVQN
jgi:hypothetical protein